MIAFQYWLSEDNRRCWNAKNRNLEAILSYEL